MGNFIWIRYCSNGPHPFFKSKKACKIAFLPFPSTFMEMNDKRRKRNGKEKEGGEGLGFTSVKMEVKTEGKRVILLSAETGPNRREVFPARVSCGF